MNFIKVAGRWVLFIFKIKKDFGIAADQGGEQKWIFR